MIDAKKAQNILIIGAAGGLAQLVIRLIYKKHPHWNIIGVDQRSMKNLREIGNVRLLKLEYTRGNFENLFRNFDFDHVLHLGRMTHLRDEISKRFDLNVMGTSRILELSLRKNIQSVLILSTFHVYGALPDNPVFLTEESPLRASFRYPEVRDVVEMDQICANWMWRYQNKVRTLVLRPCSIVGTQVRNTISRYLSGDFVLFPLDFNPFMQFIHEFDMAQTLLYALENFPTGVYNVAPDDFISLREATRITHQHPIPFPMLFAKGLAHLGEKLSLSSTPEYLLDYLTYSCLIDNKALKKHLPENFFRFQVQETIKLLKL